MARSTNTKPVDVIVYGDVAVDGDRDGDGDERAVTLLKKTDTSKSFFC